MHNYNRVIQHSSNTDRDRQTMIIITVVTTIITMQQYTNSLFTYLPTQDVNLYNLILSNLNFKM
jgi:hypothetical protein